MKVCNALVRTSIRTEMPVSKREVATLVSTETGLAQMWLVPWLARKPPIFRRRGGYTGHGYTAGYTSAG